MLSKMIRSRQPINVGLLTFLDTNELPGSFKWTNNYGTLRKRSQEKQFISVTVPGYSTAVLQHFSRLIILAGRTTFGMNSYKI